MKNIRIEVLTIVSHLIITLVILLGYVVTLLTGHNDTTLQNMLLLVGGFWFGMTGKTAITKPKDKPDSTPTDDGGPGRE
ncbi:hypothetical protein MKY96_33815 [Paenibacillus sp. FSL R7-0302]|uniref:hypothetical protein n=1 Tax=Paenibacillus sp. FSL R7-0302 TaxID=2921681 RepID=UPI0030F7F65B